MTQVNVMHGNGKAIIKTEKLPLKLWLDEDQMDEGALEQAQSFESCAHGAGRIMSRTKARKTLDLQEEVKSLKKRGILHAIRNRKDLDEAPGSYKDIDEVMSNQVDLVEVQIELQPLAVVKG